MAIKFAVGGKPVKAVPPEEYAQNLDEALTPPTPGGSALKFPSETTTVQPKTEHDYDIKLEASPITPQTEAMVEAAKKAEASAKKKEKAALAKAKKEAAAAKEAPDAYLEGIAAKSDEAEKAKFFEELQKAQSGGLSKFMGTPIFDTVVGLDGTIVPVAKGYDGNEVEFPAEGMAAIPIPQDQFKDKSLGEIQKYLLNELTAKMVGAPLPIIGMIAASIAQKIAMSNGASVDGVIDIPGFPSPIGYQADLSQSEIAALSQQQEPGVEQDQHQEQVSEDASSETLMMVDEYTAIQREIDKHDLAPLLKKQEELKKKLQLIAKSEHFAADKPVTLYGTHENYVKFSAQGNKTEISDMDGMIKFMGQDTFNQIAKVTLTDAKKVLTENQLAKFTSTGPGSRTMKDVVVGVDPNAEA